MATRDNPRVKVAEDMAALRRLGPNVNMSMHDSQTGTKEIKIATGLGNFVLFYLTDLVSETDLLWRHSIKLAARRAWHRELIQDSLCKFRQRGYSFAALRHQDN